MTRQAKESAIAWLRRVADEADRIGDACDPKRRRRYNTRTLDGSVLAAVDAIGQRAENVLAMVRS